MKRLFNVSFGIRCGALALYWLLMFVATHIPDVDRFAPSGLPSNFDKYVHFSMYLGWAAIWCWILTARGHRPSRTAMLLLLAGGAAYGAVDEITQALTRRTPDVRDWMTDLAGMLAAILVYRIWARWRLAAPAASD
jgi:VanZ family protein